MSPSTSTNRNNMNPSNDTPSTSSPNTNPVAPHSPATGEAGKPRVGQRAIASCTYCYRRKIRCNKEFPCSNCIARGISDKCHREPVVVRGTVVGGPQERVPLTMEQITQENAALRKKVAVQERLIKSLKGGNKSNTSTAAEDEPLSRNVSPSDMTVKVDSPPTTIGSNTAVSMAGPSSSRRNSENDPDVLKNCELDVLGLRETSGRNQGAPFSANGNASLRANNLDTPHSVALLDLVPLETSTFLVEAHFRLLEWVHCVVHVPNFLQEHAMWLDCLKRGEREVSPRYDLLARYFAIIASSLYFLDDEHGAAIGYSAQDMVTLPRIWFNASLEALQRSDFLCQPSIESLQAICILPLISHAFGESVYFGSLMHCALGLAQTLKFHLLAAEEPSPGLINRELSRRMWKCLIVAECLVPAKNCQPFSLYYPPARTAEPLNANDEDLSNDVSCVPRPLHEPTIVSHLIGMGRLADLFREFNQVIFALPTIDAQFEFAVTVDNRLLHLLDFCPSLKPRSTPYPTRIDIHAQYYDYLPWARHLWATIIPLHRVMIFRLFLGKSYHDTNFTMARQICLNSAREFFAERRRPAPKMYRKSWHVSSLTVLAGMVLGTELVHGNPTPPQALGLRAEVLEAMQQLADPGNAMTHRGIALLQQMISEYDRLSNGPLPDPQGPHDLTPHPPTLPRASNQHLPALPMPAHASSPPQHHIQQQYGQPQSQQQPQQQHQRFLQQVGGSNGNGFSASSPPPNVPLPQMVPPTMLELPTLETLWPSTVNDQDWSWYNGATEWPANLFPFQAPGATEINMPWFGAVPSHNHNNHNGVPTSSGVSLPPVLNPHSLHNLPRHS